MNADEARVGRPPEVRAAAALLCDLLDFGAVGLRTRFRGPVAVGDERDPPAVGRPDWLRVRGLVVGQPLRLAGPGLDDVDGPVAVLVGGDDEQARRTGLRCGRGTGDGDKPGQQQERGGDETHDEHSEEVTRVCGHGKGNARSKGNEKGERAKKGTFCFFRSPLTCSRWRGLGEKEECPLFLFPVPVYLPLGQQPSGQWDVITAGVTGKIVGGNPDVPQGWTLLPKIVGGVNKGFIVKK